MAAQMFHLLTSTISHDGLSEVTQKILGIVKDQCAVDHPQIGPVVGKVGVDYGMLPQAMTRKSRSEYTEAITIGHRRRCNDLIALRYLLRSQQKQGLNPEAAKAAEEVKAALVNSGVWKSKNLSHQRMSSLIVNMIQVLSTPENRDKLTTMGATDAFNALIASHKKYEALEAQRVEEKTADTTVRIASARENLFQSMSALAAFITVSAKIDPAFGVAAERIDTVVREANAVTRSGKTRRDNAVTSTPLCDRETEQVSDRESEQAEAAVNGQGSTSAGGAVQHAAFPPQGNLVTGVTPETNPLAPPIGKGVSTG
jgi:hypothetical protein